MSNFRARPSTDQLVIGLPELQVRSSNSAWAIAEVVGFRDISLDFDISKYSLLHHGAPIMLESTRRLEHFNCPNANAMIF